MPPAQAASGCAVSICSSFPWPRVLIQKPTTPFETSMHYFPAPHKVASAGIPVHLAQRQPANRPALPHMESDFAFFTKHFLCGSFLRFQPNYHFPNFPSPKRPEAQRMRFKRQIPGEAISPLYHLLRQIKHLSLVLTRRSGEGKLEEVDVLHRRKRLCKRHSERLRGNSK